MSTSSSSSSCVSTLYKECPSCTVMIEHTGGCDLISCTCGIFFSFTFPDINGKDKDQIQIAIQKKKKSEWMKQDRKNNPEKYRKKDKAKYEKIMNSLKPEDIQAVAQKYFTEGNRCLGFLHSGKGEE